MNKRQANTHRQNFLLSVFIDNHYQEKEVNGFWLVKQWNGGKNEWQVAIFTKESFESYKELSRQEQLDKNRTSWEEGVVLITWMGWVLTELLHRCNI